MQLICKKCGLIDQYRTEERTGQNCAFCLGCGYHIKNVPKKDPLDLKIYFGKFKGTTIRNITDKQYLQWVIQNCEKMNERYKDAIQQQIDQLPNKTQ